ncbi:MarR family winged helix-turn-helix transcriptional regulator [Dermacoccaceae bacterium W4C1]
MAPAARRRLAADLRQVCMRISRRTRFENTQELAPHQFSVLAQLEKGMSRPGELAKVECVSAPSMSRTVAALVERGLIERTDDPDDGRASVLSLTAAGRAALSAVRRSRDAWMFQRLEGLTDAECQVLAEAQQILGRVAAR